VSIDAHDPQKIAEFWGQVLDYEVKPDPDPTDGELEVEVVPRDGKGQRLLIVEVHDEKKVKNRVHFDLTPDDQGAEVERVLALGATKVDIGQGETTWVVMADPEGNEFCILRPKPKEND
jgi:predicted enzyme related to lactoylglutathione lyase